jgi:hypothetical protein
MTAFRPAAHVLWNPVGTATDASRWLHEPFGSQFALECAARDAGRFDDLGPSPEQAGHSRDCSRRSRRDRPQWYQIAFAHDASGCLPSLPEALCCAFHRETSRPAGASWRAYRRVRLRFTRHPRRSSSRWASAAASASPRASAISRVRNQFDAWSSGRSGRRFRSLLIRLILGAPTTIAGIP